MDYRQKPVYTTVQRSKEAEPEETGVSLNVYFRDNKGKLATIHAANVEDHGDAILEVKEALVASGEGWNAPVLAVIKGGKQ